MERKLAVILAADVAGYSRLVAVDEEATLATLATYRNTIADLIAEHSGRIFGTAGDSVSPSSPAPFKGCVPRWRSSARSIAAMQTSRPTGGWSSASASISATS